MAVLRAGDLFDSFDEVEQVIKEYERTSFVNFYITDSQSIGCAAKKAPKMAAKARKELKYHRLVYACIHGGRKFKSKSRGRRKHQSTFRQECPVKIRFGLTPDAQQLVLVELNENHNHQVSEASFIHMPRQRKLDEDEKTEAVMLMNLKVNKQTIQEHLQSKTGKVITLRDLLNIKNGRRVRSDGQNELESVVQLLQTNERSIVEVAITEDSSLVGIFYQDQGMQNTFAEFPELLMIDMSNKINDIHMLLYVLMILDGNGKTEVVATFLASDPSQDTFRHVIQTFMMHNPDHEKIRAVMTEKNFLLQHVLAEELPNASLEEEFVECFRETSHSSESRSLEKMESVSEKLKTVCARHTALVDFYKELLTVLHSLSAEHNHRVMQMFLKKPICPFPVDSPEAAYIQILTPYAFNLLRPHLETYRTVDVLREVDDIACEFVTSLGRIVTSLDACPCFFRISTGLPCRHIMAVRYLKNVNIYERPLVPDRWTRTYNAAHRVLVPSNGAALQVPDDQPNVAEVLIQPPAVSSVKTEKLKMLSNHQKYKRAVAITNELASLAAEAPMSLYVARLQQIKELRDSWKAERPASELLLNSFSASNDDVQTSMFAPDDALTSAVKIGGEDMVAVGVCETELVDIANSVERGITSINGNWISDVENAMRYSDIKLPLKTSKRGRMAGGLHRPVTIPKKRLKV